MPSSTDVTLPTDREVRVTRTFDAPRQRVWDAHTKPDLVRRWMLGPDGWSMPVCEIDLRVGGAYRYRWRNDATGEQFGFEGEFREVAAPGRLVHSERFEGTPSSDETDSVNTMELTERDGRTTMVYTMRFPSAEVRDQAVGTGMTDGMTASYDRLEREVLAAHAA